VVLWQDGEIGALGSGLPEEGLGSRKVLLDGDILGFV
jgi:hypothetical protein